MSFSKQKIAAFALCVSFVGATVTYSYASNGFFFALLYHGFLASLIGGLADWFAVVALFRKPLGISYHTEILKRNRARIMDEIVSFVVHDILSGENIMRVLKKENMAGLLISYLKERGGNDRLMAAISEILSAWLINFDFKKISVPLASSVKNALLSVFETETAKKVLNIALQRDREVITALSYILEDAFKSEKIQNSLKEKINDALEDYTQDSIGRSMLIGFLDLNEDSVLEKINNGLFAKLDEIRKGEGENYEALRSKLLSLVNGFAESDKFDEKLKIAEEYAAKNITIEDKLEGILRGRLKSDELKRPIVNFLREKLDEFESSEKLRQKVDEWLKAFIAKGINKHHDIIETLVRERLDKFSEDEFSNFVEEKVNDDLQMIRVNGAIIGGICGMALYIITYAAERAFGL